MLALRRPAPADFLARRLAAIDWRDGIPETNSRWALVETCRAELEWVDAEWRRLGGDAATPRSRSNQGPHPAESLRLPHEHAAARLVNCHLHVDVSGWRIRTLARRLPAQRRAARDEAQSVSYRAAWINAAAGTLSDLQDYRRRRALAWRAFLAAATEYRHLRAQMEAAAERKAA